MAHFRIKDTNALDSVYDHFRLGEFLAAVYEGSDYRFGTLCFQELTDEADRYREQIFAAGRGLPTWVYNIPTLLHPEKGALIFGVPHLGSDTSPEDAPELIEEKHSEMVRLEHKIRQRLEEIGYWHTRAIVFSVGLVTYWHLDEDDIPESVPSDIMVDRSELAEFAAAADRIFDYYTTRQAQPVSEWCPRLIEDLTDSPNFIGKFLDEDHLIEGHERSDREFDGLVRRAADRPGERRASA